MARKTAIIGFNKKNNMVLVKAGGKKKKTKKVSLKSMMTIQPSVRLISHRYNDDRVLTCTLGVPDLWHISANGMYDPNITGTGHQPFMYDQLAALYNHYVVKSSKITVYVHQTGDKSGVTTRPSYCGVYLNDDGTSPDGGISVSSLIESRKSPMRIVMSRPTETPTSCKFKKSFSAAKFFGVKDIRDNLALIGAYPTANPTEGAFYTVFIGACDGVSTTGSFAVSIVVDYIAEWTEPKDINQS